MVATVLVAMVIVVLAPVWHPPHSGDGSRTGVSGDGPVALRGWFASASQSHAHGACLICVSHRLLDETLVESAGQLWVGDDVTWVVVGDLEPAAVTLVRTARARSPPLS
jgi:hypothetical protein